MTDPLDTVSTVDRGRQEKEALRDELWAAVTLARQKDPQVDTWALGCASVMLAPGQLRALIDAVNRYGR